MYEIEFTPAAFRQFRKLPKCVQRRIRFPIDNLSANPRPPGVKKLRATTETYRLRIGGYRVKFSIDDKERTVTIVEIVHRRDAY